MEIVDAFERHGRLTDDELERALFVPALEGVEGVAATAQLSDHYNKFNKKVDGFDQSEKQYLPNRGRTTFQRQAPMVAFCCAKQQALNAARAWESWCLDVGKTTEKISTKDFAYAALDELLR